MSRTALLVIDVQDSFLHRDYFRDDDMPAYQEAQTRLILGAMAKNVPVVRILHVDGDPEFTLESGLVRPMAWLPDHSDVTIEKHVHNAFTDTGLDRWLRERGISRVIVSGIRQRPRLRSRLCDRSYLDLPDDPPGVRPHLQRAGDQGEDRAGAAWPLCPGDQCGGRLGGTGLTQPIF